MGTIKTTNIETITGSGTLTLGQSGETITIPSGVTITNNGTQTGFGGTNTPNFWVYLSTNQSIPNITFTLVEFNTVVIDTASAFNTGTYTYTIPSSGKYYFASQIRKENFTSNRNLSHLRINGTTVRDFETGSGSLYGASTGSTIENLSINDTVTFYYYQNSGTTNSLRGGGPENTFFCGFKIIE